MGDHAKAGEHREFDVLVRGLVEVLHVRHRQLPQAAADTTVLPPQEIGTIRIGQTMRGLLEPGDWTMGDGTYADVWYFQAEAGQRVIIELASRAFDSYLQLLDPAGARLAENDDGLGRDRGARITYMVRETGRFQIVVKNYDEDPRTGSYQITLR